MDPAALRARFDALARELRTMDARTPPAQRSAVRRRIVQLYQEVDAAALQLAELRQSVQDLGELFRRASAEDDAAADAPATEGSGTGRAEDLDVSTYLDRAWNCLATCRYEDALEEVTRALERAPASAQAETLRGWALMRLDRLAESRSVLEEVLRADPSSAMARACLGYVALREGNHPEALEQLSLAARDGTDRKAVLYAHLYLGMLYTGREMFRDGRSFLSRAVELGPALVEAYWEMGRSYYLEGQFTQALETWRRGAEVNRFDPWGERCQQAVDRATTGESVLLD